MPELLSKTLLKRVDHKYSLILDVGTSGVKAFVFDAHCNVLVRIYKRLGKKHSRRGWAEQNPEELVSASQKVLQDAVCKSRLPVTSFFALGITNQRETTICWNKKTGEPVYPAIVWEDTRTRRFCVNIKKKYERVVRGKTGLVVNHYFSASKVWWILKHIPHARELAEKHDLAFGTVDSWLIWNFLEGNPHCTDYTNASRTLLFNIKTLQWDKKLIKIFGIPTDVLPRVLCSKSSFGNLKKEIVGAPIPLNAVCGDQQASMYAAGTARGTTKVTYGTGTFVMQILGERFTLYSDFFTTLVPNSKRPLYALEMKINNTGRRVEEFLQKGLPIDTVFTDIAKDVDIIIKKLPIKTKMLIVDGGIIRSSRAVLIQAATSKIKMKPQSIFDGTALGVAKMVSSSHT